MEPAGENEPKPAGSAPCQPGGEGTTEPPPGRRQAVNPQEQISRRFLNVTTEKKKKKSKGTEVERSTGGISPTPGSQQPHRAKVV